MARDSGGTYTKPSGTTATAGQKARASQFNNLANDLATEMTDSLSRSGKGGMQADLAMGNHKVTGLATPTAGTDAATKTYADGLLTTAGGYARGTASWGGTGGGTADAVTVTLSPAPAAYAAGMMVRFVAGGTNTGAATLNVNSLGAIALRKGDGSVALAAGDIVSGTIVEAVYETGSPNRFRLLDKPVATAANYRANTAGAGALEPGAVWSAMAEVTLTDAATVAWDMSTGFDFSLTLGGNRAMAAPSNVKVGQKGRLRIIQDATGSRTLSWHANFDFAGGTAPTLSTAAAAKDVLYYDCITASSILITVGAKAYA